MKALNGDKGKALFYACLLVLGLALGIGLSLLFARLADYSNLVAAIAGALVALLVPIWQTYFIQKSQLALEVNGISRKVSERARISLDEHSELAYLRKMREKGRHLSYWGTDSPIVIKSKSIDRSVSLEELEDLLAQARQEMKDAPERISDRKVDLEKINAFTEETFSKHECNKLNRPLHPEIEYDNDNVSGTLSLFKDHFAERLSEAQEKYEELQSSIPSMERKVNQIKLDLVENKSYFEISATLINSGRLNTSIKRPALFRVYIGKENYIDLKLTLNEFEVKSEISPNSTVVGTFSSTDISQLPEEDRKLINTYWGQSVQCRLFVEDVHGEPAGSNTIAFSEGLYQKIIFDRLAVVATHNNV